MTNTLKGMTSMPKEATKTAKPGQAERAAVRELVKAARQGRGPDRPGRPAHVDRKQLLKSALEEEMTEHLGPREARHPGSRAGFKALAAHAQATPIAIVIGSAGLGGYAIGSGDDGAPVVVVARLSYTQSLAGIGATLGVLPGGAVGGAPSGELGGLLGGIIDDKRSKKWAVADEAHKCRPRRRR